MEPALIENSTNVFTNSNFSHICVAVVHTPFLVLTFSILVMTGLILAVAPRVQPLKQVAPPCHHLVNYALRIRWPDQILPSYVHEW